MYNMVTISITIPQEIRVQLKKETNQSGLITRLLKEYFEKNDDPEILKIKRDQLQEKLKNEIREMEYQIEIKEKEKESEIEIENKQIKKDEILIKNISNNYKDITKKDITEDILNKAVEEWNSNDDFNLFEFINNNAK